MSEDQINQVIDSSINPKTLKQYESTWKIFVSHCVDQNINALQCTPEQCMSFLYKISESSGISRVYTFLSAISFHYRRENLESPCDNPRLRMFMKGLRRQDSHRGVKRAKPITTEILTKLVLKLKDSDGLLTWRTVWRICISFTCFLRFDDIRRLKVEHLHLEENENGPYYKLQLLGGKTNQLNRHEFRVIPKTSTTICPFNLTQRYLAKLGPNHHGSLQPSCSPRSPHEPHPTRVIGYPTALENLRETLQKSGYPGHEYSEHSSKRGVATHSAKVGVPDDDIQTAGGWTNPKSMRLYIERDPRQSQRLAAKLFNF